MRQGSQAGDPMLISLDAIQPTPSWMSHNVGGSVYARKKASCENGRWGAETVVDAEAGCTVDFHDSNLEGASNVQA